MTWWWKSVIMQFVVQGAHYCCLCTIYHLIILNVIFYCLTVILTFILNFIWHLIKTHARLKISKSFSLFLWVCAMLNEILKDAVVDRLWNCEWCFWFFNSFTKRLIFYRPISFRGLNFCFLLFCGGNFNAAPRSWKELIFRWFEFFIICNFWGFTVWKVYGALKRALFFGS